MACLWGEELICGPAASNSINRGLYHHYHVTLAAYEEILELISFTDHQDTHSPSFPASRSRCCPNSFPPPFCFALLHTDECVPTYAYTMNLSVNFTLKSCCNVAADSESDLCGISVMCTVFC